MVPMLRQRSQQVSMCCAELRQVPGRQRRSHGLRQLSNDFVLRLGLFDCVGPSNQSLDDGEKRFVLEMHMPLLAQAEFPQALGGSFEGVSPCKVSDIAQYVPESRVVV